MHQVFKRDVTWQFNSCGKFMQRSLSLLVLLMLCNSSQAQEEPTLVLNDTNAAPFTTAAEDGFLDIIVGEAFHRAGLRLKLVRLPPERGLLNANDGLEDGDLTRIAGLEKKYPNLMRVPEKLMDWHFVAFARQQDIKHASWESVAQYSVGHIRGWKIIEQHLKQYPPKTPISIVEDEAQLFTMLDKGRIDIALYERWLGLALIQRLGIKNIHIVEPTLDEREMYIYLNKRHADKIPAIAAALRAIKAEGTYTRVCQQKLATLGSTSAQCRLR